MRLLILDGSTPADPDLRAVGDALEGAARRRNLEIVHRRLAEESIAWCQGCFECWTHSPGVCKTDDLGRSVSEDYVRSDAVVLITRSPFGAYGAEVKKGVDRLLGTLLPFFNRVDGEVHHFARYPSTPRLGLLALLDRPDAEAEATLRTLVLRNALNTSAPLHAVETVVTAPGQEVPAGGIRTPEAAARALLTALVDAPVPDQRTPTDDVRALVPSFEATTAGSPPRRAMLLVGSAKPKGASTSEALGRALTERLAQRGVAPTPYWVQRDAHSPEGLARLIAGARRADLLIIASPLYFDSFPALVTGALEAIVADRSSTPSPLLAVTALLNCGFPEAAHCAVAVAQAALFARAAGARWLGALALGGGGVIHGRALTEVGRVVAHLPVALDKAAEALAAGRAIPSTAQALFERELMPTSLYMAAGDAGWLWTAGHEGTLQRLWAQPVTR